MHQFDRNVNIVDALGCREITAKDKDLLYAIEIVVVLIDSTHTSQELSQLPLGRVALQGVSRRRLGEGRSCKRAFVTLVALGGDGLHVSELNEVLDDASCASVRHP